MFNVNVNVKKAGLALKNALLLTLATSTTIFMAMSVILRLNGSLPLDLPIEGDLLGYYWANMSLYSQIFSWVFVVTLIQVIIAKKVIKKSAHSIE